jgi:hypothetical protein
MKLGKGYADCQGYPNCICASLHRIYEELLTEWCDPMLPPPSAADIRREAPAIWLMLMCLSEHCPEFALKSEAFVQLHDKVWDELGLPRRRMQSDLARARQGFAI